MKMQFILCLVITALFTALTGCAGISMNNPITPVDDQMVTAQLQFVDGAEIGPLYSISVTVPDGWVGQFETRSVGNTLYFDQVTAAGTSAPIFFIEALSPTQYWDQVGGHPGSWNNIINRGDTYFIYYLPIDAYYSGLPEEEFTALAEAVPGIVSSFTVETAN